MLLIDAHPLVLLPEAVAEVHVQACMSMFSHSAVLVFLTVTLCWVYVSTKEAGNVMLKACELGAPDLRYSWVKSPRREEQISRG